MTLDELRTTIDFHLQGMIGQDASRQLNVWLDSRSHRFSFDPEWDVSYSLVIERPDKQLLAETLRLDRKTPEALLAAFLMVVLPRVSAWFSAEVAA